jgi:integrase
MSDDNYEIHRYAKQLKETGRGMAAERYSSSLRAFSGWLGSRNRDFDTFTNNDVEVYFRGIPNPNTANAFLAALRGYMVFRCGTLQLDDPNVMRETQRVNQLRLVRTAKIHKKREKVALTPDELRSLISTIEKTEPKKDVDIVVSGVVVQFYFGGRPVELHDWMRKASISWDKNSMIIMTAKTHRERFLAWHPNVTPYLRRWYQSLPLKGGSRWITRKLAKYSIGGMKITAKTGRKTVQTQFRIAKVDDMITDMVLGHTISKIADIYTDFEQFDSMVRDVMVNKHYMITEKII